VPSADQTEELEEESDDCPPLNCAPLPPCPEADIEATEVRYIPNLAPISLPPPIAASPSPLVPLPCFDLQQELPRSPPPPPKLLPPSQHLNQFSMTVLGWMPWLPRVQRYAKLPSCISAHESSILNSALRSGSYPLHPGPLTPVHLGPARRDFGSTVLYGDKKCGEFFNHMCSAIARVSLLCLLNVSCLTTAQDKPESLSATKRRAVL
jgi:hypothetical protein